MLSELCTNLLLVVKSVIVYTKILSVKYYMYCTYVLYLHIAIAVSESHLVKTDL